MTETKITQRQAIDVVVPLLEYLQIDYQDVSRVEFTANAVTVDGVNYQGQTTTWKIPYAEGGN